MEITVERETYRDGDDEVFDEAVTVAAVEAVTVAADETETLDVQGDGSFRVTVVLGERRLQFSTFPTCDEAFTRVTVSDERTLTAKTRDCEGVKREFPGETSTTESDE